MSRIKEPAKAPSRPAHFQIAAAVRVFPAQAGIQYMRWGVAFKP